uniref:Uncharacterized protein n=1 Tax=Oryza glumipatula TaxID=40148 RepID=A0A0D9ZXD1_9ORYZ
MTAPAPKQEELLPHAVKDQLSAISYCLTSPPPWPEAILPGFQHYLVMLGTTVIIPTTLEEAEQAKYVGDEEEQRWPKSDGQDFGSLGSIWDMAGRCGSIIMIHLRGHTSAEHPIPCSSSSSSCLRCNGAAAVHHGKKQHG